MDQTQTYTMFQESWWLDATAPDAWDAVEIEKGGQIQARLPFTIEERWGTRTLAMPRLTQSLGPWVRDTGAGYTKALSREMSLYRELIAALPKHDLFSQNFAPDVTNWMPFYWEGFSQTTKYTYTLDLTQSLDSLLLGMDKRNRRQLRGAQTRMVATTSSDVSTFLDLNEQTFARQNLPLPYTRELVHRIDEAAQKNAHRWIVFALDPDEGTPQAGIYMVQYGNRMYSLMSGISSDTRGENGMIVARWKAIEISREAGASMLDLQGSMIRSIERRNRNYGAHQIPYFAVSRSNGRVESAAVRHRRLRAPLIAAWKVKERALHNR